MKSHKKLELSKETVRCLTSDLPSEQLMDVRGGNASFNTCLECATEKLISPTWIETDCWHTRF